MTREYLKKAEKTAQSDAADVRQTVQTILDEIERGGVGVNGIPPLEYPTIVD